MKTKLRNLISTGGFLLLVIMLGVAAAWAQSQTPSPTSTSPSPAPSSSSGGAEPAATDSVLSTNDSGQPPMLTPPPVAQSGYSMAFSSERRSNYLRGGITFQAAHDDDLLTSTTGKAVGDWSYSIWPTISLDQSWPRFHWTVTYIPGFTFYQNSSSYNQQDHNLAIAAQYRLSPHVTLSLHDELQRTSNLFNQPLLESGSTVTGVAQGPNYSIVSPVSDVLRNNAGAELSYQFARNDMVGVGGNFSNLHFLNQTQISGLYDASVRGATAFYTHRISARHYLGVAYLYQDLLSYPPGLENQTQTHTALGFYSYYPTRTLSFSVFAGPQHSDSVQFGGAHLLTWSTAAGASAAWQGRRTSLAASYLRTVTDGGGLVGAVHSSSVNASARQQLTKLWSAGAQAGYAENTLLNPDVPSSFSLGGHTVSGSLWAQRLIGEHFTVQLGYAHIHQSYSDITAIAPVTDRNREWVSISYQFVRPLGR